MNSVDLIPFRVVFESALMYELERKRVITGNQPEPTDILLFVAWKSEGYEKFYVFANLIECDKQSYWRKTTLKEYYQRYANQLCTYTGPTEDIWLMSDGTVLMTRLELDFAQRNDVLDITISEVERDNNMRAPVHIDLER
jgi:hypothetical protein